MTALHSETSLAGLRLLVVEDEYMVAEHIGMLLEDFGCDVAGMVGAIEDALAAVEDGRLDGVLLDANLNGDSTAPIASKLIAASVPFIVVTGYGGRELGDNTLNAAPRLTKPFSPSDFKRALIEAFAR